MNQRVRDLKDICDLMKLQRDRSYDEVIKIIAEERALLSDLQKIEGQRLRVQKINVKKNIHYHSSGQGNMNSLALLHAKNIFHAKIIRSSMNRKKTELTLREYARKSTAIEEVLKIYVKSKKLKAKKRNEATNKFECFIMQSFDH